MPPASSLVGPCGSRSSELALQFGICLGNARWGHHLQCKWAAASALQWRFRWRFSSRQLRSRRVVDREPPAPTSGVTKARVKGSHGIRDRRSAVSHVAVAPFGGYSLYHPRARTSGRGRRAWRDTPRSAPPESEEEDRSSSEAAESESSRGMSARNLVGTYAASTALAVQESLPPEGVIVLLACLVGVLTGGSVVLFNLAVSSYYMPHSSSNSPC
jgi:hypothetical protein